MDIRKLLFLLLAFPLLVYGQSQHQNFAWTISGQNIIALPGAQVYVCAGSVIPSPNTLCSPTTTIYTSASLTTPAANPLTTDAGGNYTFWGVAGQSYIISVSATGYQIYSYSWTAPGLGNLTNAPQTLASIMPNTAPLAGQIPVGNGSAYVPLTMNGDCTITIGGAMICTKTNGSAFVASATVDTTNASNISSGTLPAARIASTWGTLQTFSSGLTSNGPNALSGGGSLSGTFTGNPTLSGNPSFTGTAGFNVLNATTISASKLNNILVVDGTVYTTLAGAFAACGSACTIDMRGNSNSSALSLSSFDPGSASVTILLGPYSYTGAITLRTNLSVIGTSEGSTNITQVNASTPVFLLPTSGSYPAIVAQHVHISDLVLNPVVSSTSDAISIVAAPNGGCLPQPSCQATNPGGGLWYSDLERIFIQPGFGRNPIRIDGTLAGSPTSAVQFTAMRNVWAFRKTNGPPALYITGTFIGQMTIDACQFDAQFGGQDTTSNLENVYIDDTAGQGAATFVPYSIKFQNVTSQYANGPNGAAFRIKGGSNILIENGHFESDLGIMDAVIGPGGHSSLGIVVMNPFMDHSANASLFSGVPANTGFLVHSDGNSSVDFIDGTLFGTPDNWWTGTPTYVTFSGVMMNGSNGLQQAPQGIPVANLPSASLATTAGSIRHVGDSTSIATEGQVCAGSSSHSAIAMSDGVQWRCF